MSGKHSILCLGLCWGCLLLPQDFWKLNVAWHVRCLTPFNTNADSFISDQNAPFCYFINLNHQSIVTWHIHVNVFKKEGPFFAYLLTHISQKLQVVYGCCTYWTTALPCEKAIVWVRATYKVRCASYGCEPFVHTVYSMCNLRSTSQIWMFYILNHCPTNEDV